MKQLKPVRFLLSLLMIGFILSSCSKSKSKTDDSAQTFIWKTNGNSFVGGPHSWAQKMLNPHTMIVYGEADAGPRIQLSLVNCDTVGTYVAGSIIYNNYSTVHLEGDGNIYDSGNCFDGEQVIIRVTELSSLVIKGNFEGTLCSGSLSLINISGSFNLKLRKSL